MLNRFFTIFFFSLVLLFFTKTAYSIEQVSIAENLICQNRLEEASRVTWTNLRKNEILDDKVELLNTFVTIVELNILKGEPDSALIYSRKCLHLLSPITDSLLIARAWCAIGAGYGMNEKFDSCVYYSFKAINYGRIHSNNNVLIKGYTTLGVMQNVVGDYTKALAYFQKVKTLCVSGNSRQYLSYCLYNIGLTYVSQKKYKEGLHYLEEAEIDSKVSGNYKLLIYIYSIASDCYCYSGDRSKWKEYIEMATSLSESFGDKRTQLVVLRSKMKDALKYNEHKRAIKYGEEVLNILNDYSYPSFKAEMSRMLYEAYQVSGELSKALGLYEGQTIPDNSLRQESLKLSKAEILPEGISVNNENPFSLTKFFRYKYLLLLLFVMLSLFFIARLTWTRIGFFGNTGFKEVVDHQFNRIWGDHEIAASSQHALSVELGNNESIHNQDVDEKYRLLFEEFERIVTSNKLYLDYNLTQKDVIKFLGTNRKYFYMAVSQHSNNNFKRLLNNLRIREAKRIIEDRVKTSYNLTVMDVYASCGFASNESFYRVFKSITGYTPGQYANIYIDEIKKQCKFNCTSGIPCSIGIFQTNCRFYKGQIN